MSSFSDLGSTVTHARLILCSRGAPPAIWLSGASGSSDEFGATRAVLNPARRRKRRNADEGGLCATRRCAASIKRFAAAFQLRYERRNKDRKQRTERILDRIRDCVR